MQTLTKRVRQLEEDFEQTETRLHTANEKFSEASKAADESERSDSCSSLYAPSDYVSCSNAPIRTRSTLCLRSCVCLYVCPCSRSTQPCIPPGSLSRVPASAGVRAGMSPLPGGR